MVDLKGDLAKSTIESLRDWDETLKLSGFLHNSLKSPLSNNKGIPRKKTKIYTT